MYPVCWLWRYHGLVLSHQFVDDTAYKLLMDHGMWCNGNASCITGPLWGESTSHWWIPPQRARNVGFDINIHMRSLMILETSLSMWRFEPLHLRMVVMSFWYKIFIDEKRMFFLSKQNVYISKTRSPYPSKPSKSGTNLGTLALSFLL